MRLRRGFLGAAGLFLASPSASAQEMVRVEPPPPIIEPEKRPEKIQEVMVHAKPPPRSASDWEANRDTLSAAPHETGADMLNVVPGVFVTERGLLGRAPHLSLRGFDGTAGQDVEIFVANIPMNQASNLRAPGYADMRLVMPEVVKDVRVSHGPYDPRQGDFAIAGSVHMDLGLEKPGFLAKGTMGSFGARRVFLAFAPNGDEDRSYHWADTFAAFESYSTDGVGSGRAGERSSFVGQVGGSGDHVRWRSLVAIGTARFDFPGFLAQGSVERGGYPYAARFPLGRDRTSQGHLGADIAWDMAGGTFTLGAFASKTKMQIHQNLTGYVLNSMGDDSEQVNDASTLGLSAAYRHGIALISDRDFVELGTYSRLDTIDQTDTRIFDDGRKRSAPIDATIGAVNLAAFIDASLYPLKRLVVRGGTRLDALSYTVKDRTSDQALERTAEGVHLGNKATLDYALLGGVHLLASYGDGFRSPQARDLREGDRVPFATVHSVEAGVRVKRSGWAASLVGFQSWLSRDRVFDAGQRANIEAPSSSRAGGAATLNVRRGPFGNDSSATYARAVFTGSDERFRDGERVPYAPTFVLRNDSFVSATLGRLRREDVTGRLGVGLEAAMGRTLPGGKGGNDVFYVDALAAVSWRELELGVNGMNLLGLRYYDAQYLYASSFDRNATIAAPSAHVLVAPPTSVFVTLQIHLKVPKMPGDS